MPLREILPILMPAIESELKAAVAPAVGLDLPLFYHMLAYHLGWEGAGAGPEAAGKRLRPLLVLLSCCAASDGSLENGAWQRALPAAAAVELVHNFSLIHDDIQDNSPLRHGRPTVWQLWGIPQAINAGDALYTLAQLALLRLNAFIAPDITLLAAEMLLAACLHLTQGQHLDLAYESQNSLTLESYWEMVGGKTAALLSACTGLGALIAGCPPVQQEAFRRFGKDLGLAFQTQDDLLGIWGDSALTGKSTESDLLAGKKSMPVLYGLSLNGPFAARWQQGPLRPDEVEPLAAQLAAEGGRAFTETAAERLTRRALQALDEARPAGAAGAGLHELALKLLGRAG